MSIDVIYIIHANTALSIIDRPDHSPIAAPFPVGSGVVIWHASPLCPTQSTSDRIGAPRAIGVDVQRRVVQVQLMSMLTVMGAFKGITANALCRLEPEPVGDGAFGTN